jgi:glycosyltransferase involved in cell wall biosynthesis
MIPFEPAIRAKYPLLGRQRIRNRLLENALLKGMILSDLVIFISEFARQAILNRVPEGIRKSVVIPHGISEPFRISPDRPPTRPDWARNHEYLLYVSILDVYKNQIEVLQGYHRLKQIRKTNEKLVFVGHHATPYGRKVKKEIARLGLGGDVILTGNLPYLELPKAYFHAKMNIFASGCENCPNILLEALGAGRPLIVSNRPPMPEIGGGSLLYFDPFSPDDFTSKVATVIDDPIHLQRLSAESRERSHRYNWAETARLTWNALQRLEGEK